MEKLDLLIDNSKNVLKMVKSTTREIAKMKVKALDGGVISPKHVIEMIDEIIDDVKNAIDLDKIKNLDTFIKPEFYDKYIHGIVENVLIKYNISQMNSRKYQSLYDNYDDDDDDDD